MQHRTDDAPVSPGLWGFFGGSCEGNEEAEETLKREILEELGYMTTCVNLFHIQEFTENDVFKIRSLFIEKYDRLQKLTLMEGKAMEWIDILDLPRLKMSPADKELTSSIYEPLSKVFLNKTM